MIISKKAGFKNEMERKWLLWRKKLIPAGLITPSMILMVFLFLFGIVILFSNSVYHFTGLKIEKRITFDAYPEFFADPFYWMIVRRSLWLATVVSFYTVLIGYPTAYAISRIKNQKLVLALYILIFSPQLTSVVIRSFGWLVLLGDRGFINYMLIALGIIEQPIKLVYNFFGVTVALTHVLLPYAIFPMISVMSQIDLTLKEAANDLGAHRWRTFRRIFLPLSLPGLISGLQITFVLAVGAFATPSILGGGRVMVLPRQIYGSITTLNWPLAAVQGIVLLAISLLIVFAFNLLFKLVYQPSKAE